MNRNTALVAGLLSALVLASSACKAPKYVRYVSPFQDFTCEVPWGWAVYLDSAGSDYTSATFTGPLEPEFLRGIPSLTVRWYSYNAPHKLPDGSYETYSSVEDFTRQMLRDVYGPDAYTKAGSDYDQALAASKEPPMAVADQNTIRVSGAPATFYIVYRTAAAPPGANVGVVQDAQGNSVVRQRHAYVLLPMQIGRAHV
jgi:hypothetical protein